MTLPRWRRVNRGAALAIPSVAIGVLAIAPAVAGAYTSASSRPDGGVIAIRLVDRARIARRELGAVKRALTVQVDRDLDRYWPAGRLRFARSGWTITIEPSNEVEREDGLHSINQEGRPYALVAHSYDWTVALSHELLELVTDPYLNRWIGDRLTEICDPVQNVDYVIDGVRVSDFVFPGWFRTVRRAGAYLSWTRPTRPPT